MAEETKQVETTPVTETKPETKPEETNTETVAISKAEFDKMQAALKDANKEAAARRKRLDELEAADAKRKEAEMTEAQKAEAKIKELEAKTKQYERTELQRTVAAKVGLPANLATRLMGETEEELEADAKALLETLPKPEDKKPSPGPTNPGEGGQPKETDAEKYARLTGQTAISNWAKGGGVIFNE
jgi:multidrug resistance efflux pump